MIQQGTPEWHAQRIGKVTASKVADVIARTKSGYSASRSNYMAQLVAERLTNTPYEGFTNAAMQWGIETEAQARAAYKFHTDNEVQECGFITHPTIDASGASPDGLVNDDGLVEIKCPNTSTHIETVLSGEVDKKYITQIQWQLACTGRKWCDFISFDPRLPMELQLKIIRVDRDDKLISELETEVINFLHEINAKIDALKNVINSCELEPSDWEKFQQKCKAYAQRFA